MPTWEEILDANYNPVNSVRERHQATIDARRNQNIARMQAANPGFQPGGNDTGGGGNPAVGSGPQYQQFGPPTVMDNQDSWLTSQANLANEHMGGSSGSSGGNEAPTYLPSNAVQGGREDDHGSFEGGGQTHSPMGAGYDSEAAINQGLADLGVDVTTHPGANQSALAGFFLGPAAGAVANNTFNTQLGAFNDQMAADELELSNMFGADLADPSTLPSTTFNNPELNPANLSGVGLPSTGGDREDSGGVLESHSGNLGPQGGTDNSKQGSDGGDPNGGGGGGVGDHDRGEGAASGA
jgi:hypothetical protein